MPSPVVDHAVPLASIAAPRRPHAPPLPALNVITVCCGSSTRTAAIVMPAYLSRTVRRLQTADDEHRHQRVQRAHLIPRLDLPEDLQVLHVALRQDRFVPVPARALVVAAVCDPVDRSGPR